MKLSQLQVSNTRVQVRKGGGVVPYKEEVHHHFAPGVYVRELVVPKGMIVIGRVHKFDHVFMVIKGSAMVWSSDKKGLTRIDAPLIIQASKGTQKVVKTLSDCIFVTSHSTNGVEDELLHAASDEEIKNLFTTPEMIVGDGLLQLTHSKELKWLDQC